MYSQQFTLCYFLVKSPLLIRFKNFLRHRSVSGAPPPKKNPGSAPVTGERVTLNKHFSLPLPSPWLSGSTSAQLLRGRIP